MGSINLRTWDGAEVGFLEPVDDRQSSAGLQQLHSGGEEFFALFKMRDGFHAPEKIELILESHRLGVHQQEFHVVDMLDRCGLSCDFHLYPGNRYACCVRVIGLGQMKAAGAHAATNIENIRMRLHIGKMGEMFDELKLGFFF